MSSLESPPATPQGDRNTGSGGEQVGHSLSKEELRVRRTPGTQAPFLGKLEQNRARLSTVLDITTSRQSGRAGEYPRVYGEPAGQKLRHRGGS